MPDLNKEQKFVSTPESEAPQNEGGIRVENEPTEIENKENQSEEKNAIAEKIHHKIPFIKRKPIHIMPQVRDEMTVRIEKILEENVGEAYSRLSPIAKQEFKLKGEVTAEKIREMLNDAHVKVKKIFRLVLEWLKMLPGVNKFFLEQEAKIKTDRIIAMHKNHKF